MENKILKSVEEIKATHYIPEDIILKGKVAAISLNQLYIRVIYEDKAFGDIYMGDSGIKYKEGDDIEFLFEGGYHIDNMPIFELIERDWVFHNNTKIKKFDSIVSKSTESKEQKVLSDI